MYKRINVTVVGLCFYVFFFIYKPPSSGNNHGSPVFGVIHSVHILRRNSHIAHLVNIAITVFLQHTRTVAVQRKNLLQLFIWGGKHITIFVVSAYLKILSYQKYSINRRSKNTIVIYGYYYFPCLVYYSLVFSLLY